MQVKGRFAPSPTGRMHLGNVYAALVSYLSAKSKGGRWLLRIEDLDAGRCRYEYARQIEDDLRWLGLEWDEGGLDSTGQYCQSRRGQVYQQMLSRLSALTYPCWCSRADLLSASAPHESDGRIVYPGTCRPEKFGGRFHAASNPSHLRNPSIRIFVPDREIDFVDGNYGPQSFNLARQCGDFVLRRGDGTWAYQLAVVADDALMGVTEVVRGRDLLLSAAQQLYLYELLGLDAPAFIHIPLLCSESGERLCKRDKSLDMGELRKRFSAEQLIGRLAYMCGLAEINEPRPADSLVAGFSVAKLGVRDIVCQL